MEQVIGEDDHAAIDLAAERMAHFFFGLVRRQFTRQEALELVKLGFAELLAPPRNDDWAKAITVTGAAHQSIVPDSSVKCPMDVYFGWSSCYATTIYAGELDSAAMWRRIHEIEEELQNEST